MERSDGQGDLYHFFFHPERFELLREALGILIKTAQARQIWMPTLGDLADWWRRRHAVSWRLDPSTPATVWVSSETDLSVVLRDGSRADAAEPAGHRPAEKIREEDGAAQYRAGTGDMLYAVGLSLDSHAEVEEFLHNEGYFFVRTAQPEAHSLFLEMKEPLCEEGKKRLLRRLADHRRPLLRLWRWPGDYRSAFCVSADVCAVSLGDFLERTRNF
jgi:hypothetical protein